MSRLCAHVGASSGVSSIGKWWLNGWNLKTEAYVSFTWSHLCSWNDASLSLQVRLWDFISGTLLDTCEVGAQVNHFEPFLILGPSMINSPPSWKLPHFELPQAQILTHPNVTRHLIGIQKKKKKTLQASQAQIFSCALISFFKTRTTSGRSFCETGNLGQFVQNSHLFLCDNIFFSFPQSLMMDSYLFTECYYDWLLKGRTCRI